MASSRLSRTIATSLFSTLTALLSGIVADYAAERSGVASDEVEYGVRPLMSPFPWEIAATPGWTMAIHLESLNGPSGDVFPTFCLAAYWA